MSISAETIQHALIHNRDRTFAIVAEGKPVWVKRPRWSPGRVWHALHAAVARLLMLPLFHPAAVSLGAAGLAAEAQRLRALRAKGLPVPEVVAVSPEWLVLSDNGVSLARHLAGIESIEDRRKVIKDAFAFIQKIHASDRWHGSAQIRNITVRPDGFGLIDFEDDVSGAMPLACRQARDLLAYMLSAARYVPGQEVSLLSELLEAAQQSNPRVVEALRAAAGVFRVAKVILTPLRRWLGRDGRAIFALACALTQPMQANPTADRRVWQE